MAVPTVVPWLVGFTGAGLLVAAIKNQSPIGELRAALTGDPSTKAPIIAGGTAADLASVDRVTSSTSSTSGANVVRTPLAAPNTGLWLDKSAADAFVAWSAAFGQPIRLTGAGRTSAEQAAGWAANPERFAKPGTSLHERGAAVDVDTGWMSSLGASGQSRLRLTARATGWGQARYKRGEAGCGKAASGAAKDNDEPWHFSWGACG